MQIHGSARTKRGRGRHVFPRAIPMILAIALAGCAALTPNAMRPQATDETRERNISAALLDGKPEVARELLAVALRADPQNGYLHLLNGLSYQLAECSQECSEVAKVGYDAAVKFAAGYFWSHYLSGLAALTRRDYREAAEQFSWAILDKPDRPLAFVGLAVSGYYSGDLPIARLAAERALTLAPEDPLVLRTAAYVAAARGDRKYLDGVLATARAVPAAARDLEIHHPRLSQLLRTAPLAQGAGTPAGQPPQDPSPAVPDPAESEDPKQVLIEVTLLLSQETTTRRIGINLLDGLTLQFGLSRLTENKSMTGALTTASQIFTTALLVPQITYSLNLFNTKHDYYEVVARPSLVSSIEEPSEFFIGRTVFVGVSGVNLGALQSIDIGTAVKITPTEITRERTTFRVDTTRSFLVENSSGSFPQSLTTFKQAVAATIEIEFGKTLILSGLYEGVNVGESSKAPGLGDVPGLGTLFNFRTRTQRRDAALVLVTPRLPATIETEAREFRTETLNRLLSLWKDLIDANSDMDGIIEKIAGKVSKYFRPQAGDLRLPSATNPETLKSAVKETMGRL
jgi:pilus assembly protein CpaC